MTHQWEDTKGIQANTNRQEQHEPQNIETIDFKYNNFFNKISAIEADKLEYKHIATLEEVFQNLKARKNKLKALASLANLETESIPATITTIISILIKAASGEISSATAAENEIVRFTNQEAADIEQATIKEISELMLKYKEVREAQIYLLSVENGVKINWFKEGSENQFPGDVIYLAKAGLARYWFKQHSFRTPTEEQIGFIIDINHSIRLTARAGSGKTETIASKILFLIHYVGIEPSTILALVFNVEARDDLIDRIETLETRAKLSPKGPYAVMNFDRLAKGVVNPRQRIAKGSEIKKIVRNIVHNYLEGSHNDSSIVQNMIINSFRSDWNKWLEASKKYHPDQIDELRNIVNEEALDGTIIKSRGEKRIADFLFEHDIFYQYERSWRADRGEIIFPDFYLPEQKIIIEYLGLHGDPDYDETTEFKRKYWATKPGYLLVEFTPGELAGLSTDFIEGSLYDYQYIDAKLKEAASEKGITLNFKKLTDEEIALRLKKRIRLNVEKLFSNALTRLGQICKDTHQVTELVSNYEASTDEEKQFVRLLPTLHFEYVEALKNSHAIDFSQLKWACTEQLSAGIDYFEVERGEIRVTPSNLQYIFIDEFQDFSKLYLNIVQGLIRDRKKVFVNAVGDDWQMINRFAGSNEYLFNEFHKFFLGARSYNLTKNFRSTPNIVNFCNQIMEGCGEPAQAGKKSNEHDSPVFIADISEINITNAERVYFNSDPIICSLLRLVPVATKGLEPEISSINKSPLQPKCELHEEKPLAYALTRTNFPRLNIDSKNFTYTKKIFNLDSKNLQFLDSFINTVYEDDYASSIRALTAHSSKGKEAEIIFVIEPEGFQKVHPSIMFMQIFGDNIETSLEDERRLFYVACSRARKKLYLLTFSPSKLPDYVESNLISPVDWGNAPYNRNVPDTLFRIEVSNLEGSRSGTYDVKDRLKENGFQFTNTNNIPIWWLELDLCKADAAKHLQGLLMAISNDKIQWRLFDAGGVEIFKTPSDLSIDNFIESVKGQEDNPKGTTSSKITPSSEDLETLHPSCKSIYRHFLKEEMGRDLNKPTVGYELMKAGKIIGEAELAWPRHKAAVVLNEEDYEVFTDNNWRCWISQIDINSTSSSLRLADNSAISEYLQKINQKTDQTPASPR